ncbi:MAG: alpha/beta hydrolase [Gaiellaceae bacterium]
MHVDVNGTRLWFDVEGPALVPDGRTMRDRPTVVLVHGGPGGYDHSYLKPDFGRLAAVAQVVYLDLRGHGRSDWGRSLDWSFETCADDVRAFCDILGIERPVVLGHSLGGFIAILYGARHPGHARGLVLSSTNARFDLDRLVDAVRRTAGDDAAEIARRDYGGERDATREEWAKVWPAFGPVALSEAELARRTQNLELGPTGMNLLRSLDLVAELPRIESPTLVVVGELDGITPVEASEEIVRGVRPELGRLEVIADGGHFPWKESPDSYWAVVADFVRSVADGGL